GLSARASDLSNILDSLSNGIQTIQAANNGLTAITNVVQQLQATVSQASQDASFVTQDYSVGTIAAGTAPRHVTFSGGTVTGSVNVQVNSVNANAVLTATAAPGTAGVLSASSANITFHITAGGTSHTVTLSSTYSAGSAGTGKYALSDIVSAINGASA